MRTGAHSHQIGDVALEASLGYVAPVKRQRNQTSECYQFSLAPTQNTTSNATSNTVGGAQTYGNAYNNNVYGLPGEAALQGQVAGAQSNFLTNGAPSSFTANPQLLQSYNTAFNQAAPSLAFQGGAGSPQMQSNYAIGLSNLLGNQFNTGTANYQNALTGAGNFAINPTGTQTSTAANVNQYENSTGTANQTISQPLSLVNLLGALSGAIGGGGF
jgi:hypothetical protein